MDERLVDAHRHSIDHKPELIEDSVCGCFYCMRIFHPKEIFYWIEDKRGTALCPYCAVDSVIGESSGYGITEEFLKEMHDAFF